MSKKILVLGAGSWGTAIANVLSKKKSQGLPLGKRQELI